MFFHAGKFVLNCKVPAEAVKIEGRRHCAWLPRAFALERVAGIVHAGGLGEVQKLQNKQRHDIPDN